MENLGAMAYSRYTGFRKIMDRDVLDLHCIYIYIYININIYIYMCVCVCVYMYIFCS